MAVIEAIKTTKTPVDITTITSLSLAPPFQNMGFLETKWLGTLKELVQHGNKNIYKNVVLHLIIEERSNSWYTRH